MTVKRRARSGVPVPQAVRGPVLAFLYVVGVSISLAWALAVDAPGMELAAVTALAVLGYALALLLVLGPGRLPHAALELLLALSTLLVSAAIYFGGDPASPYTLLYVWAPPYSFALFGRARAARQIALVAAAYAVVLVLLPEAHEGAHHGLWDALRWAALVLAVATVCFVVERLASALSGSNQHLHERARQQAVVSELGRRALAGMELDRLVEEAIGLLRDTLDVELASVLELLPDGKALRMRAGLGWRDGVKESLRIPLASSSIAAYALAHSQPVVTEDLEADERFAGSLVLHEHGVVSAMTVLIEVSGRPFGILGAYTTVRRRFSRNDIHFLQSLANVLAAAVARARSEESARHQALHDPLTGLPNRTLFVERLTGALARARRDGGLVAVLFLDVDHFNVINDSLGHHAGDRVLEALAPRLTAVVRGEDTVARFGGDEFVLLCEDVACEEDARGVAERVLAALDEPLEVAGGVHRVTASMGVAIACGEAVPEAVLRDADSALYRAKERGRARYEVFDEDMRARAVARLATGLALESALERDELRLLFQPVVRAATGEIVAAEALLRWQRPGHGLVLPADFIPIAEQTDQIIRLGEWVLRTACRQCARWNCGRRGGRPLVVSVNLSARQLADPAIVDTVAAALEESGLDPRALGLEITESVLMEDLDAAVRTLCRLRDLGVMIVLDDFGAGYSSLAYVKKLPIEVIKLDRSFAEDLGARGKDGAIVAAVTAMAREIGVAVVAEGIEQAVQAERVARLGCRYAQGFHYARPLAPEHFAEILGRPLPLADGDAAPEPGEGAPPAASAAPTR